MRKFKFAMLLGLVLGLAEWGRACEHLPKDFKGTIEQTSQGGIIFWQNGRQELILKNDFRITSKEEDGKLPEYLAWVVPVPNVPDNYGVEAEEIFEDLFDAWEEAGPKERNGNMKHEADLLDSEPTLEESIKLLEKETVGEYEIQPIKIMDQKSGGEALNNWLKENGFGTVPAENMKYYVEGEWVWLAVKVKPGENEKTLSKNGSLRPLRISFESEHAVYPLMFSSHQGVFDVTLYVITKTDWKGDRARYKKLGQAVKKWGFEPEDSRRFELPESLQKVQNKAEKEGSWKPLEKPYVLKLNGLGVNGPKNRIADWKEDFQVAMAAEK